MTISKSGSLSIFESSETRGDKDIVICPIRGEDELVTGVAMEGEDVWESVEDDGAGFLRENVADLF